MLRHPWYQRCPHQAAGALDDDTYQATADHAMRTLAARDARNWDVEGPTVCHGYAGILQASHAYPDLAENSAFQILAAADQSSTYLIQHTEQGASDDDPGLLTGAAGVALALADHADVPSSCVASTRWDSILLLS